MLGVDPGSAVTGFGIVEGAPGHFQFITAGTIRTRPGEPMPERLRTIHHGLLDVIGEFAPAAVSLERSFVARNIQSAFRIGEVRAVAMLAAAQRGLPLYEYPPNAVKLAVAAFGHADKAQVKFMVRRTLALPPDFELADDASDALALAVCHLGRARAPRISAAVERPARAVAARGARIRKP
ncbi:MAG TPA: crossover junction endodeoxyribonuclease RuvC [Candidatus Binataceae bacterium]|nr:crossover junction endodeoxyribonuclease RuvC [Candidatus Binataceae bacterium]